MGVSLEIQVFLAILLATVFQASWNFLTKKTTADKTALLIVGWFLLGLVLTPFAVGLNAFDQVPQEAWVWFLATSLIHCVYVFALGWAYDVGELSVVYPVARGMGVCLTTVMSLLIGWSQLSTVGAIAIVLVVVGTISIGFCNYKGRENNKGFFVALVLAVIVSSYSLVDSQGVQGVSILAYLTAMNLGAGTLALLVLCVSSVGRENTKRVFLAHKTETMLIAAGGSLSYVIILWAFRQTQAPYVVALREFSIVVVAFLGITFLKERVSGYKLLGLGLTVVGIITLKFS